jgi:hypothetical protein
MRGADADGPGGLERGDGGREPIFELFGVFHSAPAAASETSRRISRNESNHFASQQRVFRAEPGEYGLNAGVAPSELVAIVSRSQLAVSARIPAP